MKYLALVIAGLLCILSGCSIFHHKHKPNIVALALAIKLPRVATTEYQLPDANSCTVDAKAYYNKIVPGGTLPPSISPVLESPIYSFCESCDTNDSQSKEIRFIVLAASPKQLDYWQIDSKPGNEEAAIKAAVEALKNTNCKEVQPPVQDKYPVNGKYPWRAIMSTTAPIDPPGGPPSGDKVSGTFGIVVNPPYP